MAAARPSQCTTPNLATPESVLARRGGGKRLLPSEVGEGPPLEAPHSPFVPTMLLSKPITLLTAIAACCTGTAVIADLAVPVKGKVASTPKVQTPPAPAPSPRRQVGVARRGAVPVLPAADGSAVPPFPELAPPAAAAPPALVPVTARLGKLIAPQTEVYRLPDPRSPWVARVTQGQQVAIVSQWQGWFAIVMGDGSQAYVPQTHVEVLPYEVKSVGPARPAAPSPPPPSATASTLAPAGLITTPAQRRSDAGYVELASTDLSRGIVSEALSYRGARYVWGGNTRAGVDCSGLVRNCYASRGISLPRRASEQARVGQEVPLDQLQPGDRLYFSVRKTHDHTGIYLGDGYFIHAAMSRGTVDIDHLSQRLYTRSLSAARR